MSGFAGATLTPASVVAGPRTAVMRVSPPAWANTKPFWSTLATAGVLELQTGSTC